MKKLLIIQISPLNHHFTKQNLHICKFFRTFTAENQTTMDNQNQIILYQDDNDITRVSVRFADEDLWLTQNQLAEIYCTTRENVTMHINNIYADGELTKNSTSKDFLLVRQEGNRQVQRNIAHC